MRRLIAIAAAVAVTAASWIPNTPAFAATSVGGVITSDTTWTAEGGPYEVTSTVQIPTGVTLTIEPGTTIVSHLPNDGLSELWLFLVHGTLNAVGTPDNRISFDGAGTASFFSCKSCPGTAYVNVAYANISNGSSLWPATGHEQYGHLTLRHSHILNLSRYSYIWYPKQDVFIEYNTFTNSSGFSTGMSEANVYIRYNRFVSFGGSESWVNYWIENWAGYNGSLTFVNYNVFEGSPRYALKLPRGYDSAAMDGKNNYWGTTSNAAIEDLIFDSADDITSAARIPYEPFLAQPDPNVPPAPASSTPEPDTSPAPTSTPTPDPTPTLDPTPDPDPTDPPPQEFERSLSLALRKHLIAKGSLTASDASPACSRNQKVLIQKYSRWSSGYGWSSIASTSTNQYGGYKVKLPDKPGKYRAKVKPKSLAAGTCVADLAPARVHRH